MALSWDLYCGFMCSAVLQYHPTEEFSLLYVPITSRITLQGKPGAEGKINVISWSALITTHQHMKTRFILRAALYLMTRRRGQSLSQSRSGKSKT